MTLLQDLAGYYGRMERRGEAEPPGYAREKISFAVTLSPKGEPLDVVDLRQAAGKKAAPRLLEVPAGEKRTVAIAPNFLWDKTAYSLGRTAGEGKRTAAEHAAFRVQHLDRLRATIDEGLVALRAFIERWRPEQFDAAPFRPEMLDTNIVFQLEGERGYVHERDAARRLVADHSGGGEESRAFCLVTGAEAPIRRLHPSIKGVEGAQTSGAALVSFNLDAFTSYGHEQGDNAPVSDDAAFRYGAALNRMLDRNSGNRLPRPIGDTTIVFWADAADEPAAAIAEATFWTAVEPPVVDPDNLDHDAQEAIKVFEGMKAVADGRALPALDLGMAAGVRFHVLGLSPNSSRLSVRFWLSDSFEMFARRLAAHYRVLEIEPAPWRALPPSVARLLVKTTALLEKFDNVPNMLAGEVMRAILSGTPYPRTLLSAVLIRIRAGDDPGTGWHAAVIRAVLARSTAKETPPVALDRDFDNPAYQLGRMFAMAEIAQRMALGRVNATIRDRYFGAASATPAGVFPLLLRGMQNHLAKLRKDNKGGFIERELDQIAAHLPPQLPRALRLEEQGHFVVGYYHQRRARVGGKPVDEIAEEQTPEGTDADE